MVNMRMLIRILFVIFIISNSNLAQTYLMSYSYPPQALLISNATVSHILVRFIFASSSVLVRLKSGQQADNNRTTSGQQYE